MTEINDPAVKDWLSKLNDMDRILLNRVIALEESRGWEEVPDEDLYEDGELNETEVAKKIAFKLYSGEYKLMRQKGE